MSKAIINAGVCGFVTEITCQSDDMTTAVLQISSECPGYASMNSESYTVDALSCCFGKVGQNEVFDLFRDKCKHAACPVPTAAIKAIEVACSYALPKDVTISLSK